jgi:hypothetical protein
MPNLRWRETTNPRAGLVDDVQRHAAADELAQRLVQRGEVAADAVDVAHLAVAAASAVAMSMLSLCTSRPT